MNKVSFQQFKSPSPISNHISCSPVQLFCYLSITKLFKILTKNFIFLNCPKSFKFSTIHILQWRLGGNTPTIVYTIFHVEQSTLFEIFQFFLYLLHIQSFGIFLKRVIEKTRTILLHFLLKQILKKKLAIFPSSHEINQ